MGEVGFSLKRASDIAEATFALSDWFRDNGVERPDEFMRLLSLIVVDEDQRLTHTEIAIGQAVAKAREAQGVNAEARSQTGDPSSSTDVAIIPARPEQP